MKEFYTKQEVITAIVWATGMSKSEAAEVFKETDYQFHNITVFEYRRYSGR